MPIFNPTQGGTPQLNQPVLMATNVNGTWSVQLNKWTGNLPQGYQILTHDQGIQKLQENISSSNSQALGPQGRGGGSETNYNNIMKGIPAQQAQLNSLSNLSGEYNPSKLGGLSYVIGPNGNLMTEANAKDYMPSPQEAARGIKPTGTYASGYVQATDGAMVPKGSAGDLNQGQQGSPNLPTGTFTAPTTQLKRGDTGVAVKQLQDYLVANKYMTQAQVDTGYGTFGPQTEKAVTAMQQKLGVDNKTGPGVYGPRTIAKVTVAPGGGTPTPGGGTGGDTTGGGGTTAGGTPDFTAVNSMIDGLSLAQDQKDILKLYAQANFTKNPELANNIMAALETSTKFSTPQFKQQAAMLTDALKLNFNTREGDLSFQKNQKEVALAKAEADYTATTQFGTLEEQQQMKKYVESLKNDTLELSDRMAASGFTTSSKRDRSQEILKTENEGLVESTTRKYAFERASNERDIGLARTNTAAQIANLQRLAAEGKLSDLRLTESKLGTNALSADYGSMPNLVDGFRNLVGGQVGSQNYDLTKAITGMASNFVY